MGSGFVVLPKRKEDRQNFVVKLLRDTQALEHMIEQDMFEKDPIRIGAEQELCLVDRNWKPSMNNMEILDTIDNELFTTELARFNIETNAEPMPFKGKCLSEMEAHLQDLVDIARKKAGEKQTKIILTGILPTVRKLDMVDKNITPFERYHALCKGLSDLRGAAVELNIRGIDELMTKHDSPLLEGANTGFQVHLQVTPEDFAQKYNYAQAIAGPALALATNSPLLFGKRLWHETRIALFQQSVDVRTLGDHLRKRSGRVMFGNDWVKRSILELYREDIMRFRVLLMSTLEEDPFKVLEEGGIPNLYAMQIHNSTVYRWNRPCYGVANGKPHLRIENRVLPSGPTVKDEMANAALWLGLVNGMSDVFEDVSKEMDFAEAKANFTRACRNGMNSKFSWPKATKAVPAAELLSKELIPIAINGLKKAGVNDKDITHYTDILQERIAKEQNGSQWMLKSYASLIKETSPEQAITAITASTLKQQEKNQPVHTWKLASIKDLGNWKPSGLMVEEFMQTDLFTVEPDDIVELVAEIMDWRQIRYVPVENQKGQLVGLMTSRILNRYLLDQYHKSRNGINIDRGPLAVKTLMVKSPVTISPESTITEALELMQEHSIGCLPVVQKGELVGIITEQDFLNVSGQLTYRFFKFRNSPTKK